VGSIAADHANGQRWADVLSPGPELEIVTGDLTGQSSDAIVNPIGAGLVDLAVRRLAGPALVEAVQDAVSELPNGRLPPGRVIVTPGFGLGARYVMHCRAPVYADDPARAHAELVACHVEAMRLARALGLRSISFPSIGTGVYRYPVREAAEVAVGAVLSELRAHPGSPLVRFVLHSPQTFSAFREAARAKLGAKLDPASGRAAAGAAGRS
jgi:O-acetyl-ADP-ribose deacetylase (regulator of RNase III)